MISSRRGSFLVGSCCSCHIHDGSYVLNLDGNSGWRCFEKLGAPGGWNPTEPPAFCPLVCCWWKTIDQCSLKQFVSHFVCRENRGDEVYSVWMPGEWFPASSAGYCSGTPVRDYWQQPSLFMTLIIWSLLAIWLHVKDKKVSSQELDISCCTPGSVAPFGNAEHAIDVGGRTRGRLTVWLMEKKSSGRKRNNRMNVVFTEFEETWRIWTVAESPGEAQTDVFVWVLREEGRRGEAQVWFIRNQGLTVAVPSKNWHKHCSGITCHLPERSNPPTERHYIKSEQSAAGLIK